MGMTVLGGSTEGWARKFAAIYAAFRAPNHLTAHGGGWYNLIVLPDIGLNDIVRLRKPHPCGSSDWKVVRLGADIGLECQGCNRRIMITRRELAHRLKTIMVRGDNDSLPA